MNVTVGENNSFCSQKQELPRSCKAKELNPYNYL